MKANIGKRILVVEDEIHIAEGIKLNLEREGYEVLVAIDGYRALSEWQKYNPDLIILDIMLPGIDGYTVLEHIRLSHDRLPILILSARSDDGDKIRGFQQGVDDYMTKPFNLDEFILRIKRLLALSERFGTKKENVDEDFPSTYRFGGNLIDFTEHCAECRQGRIVLTEQEQKVLRYFIKNEDKILSRKQLLEVGWGYSGALDTRTVDNFIVRFRKYFEENPKKPRYFVSLRKLGYKFSPDR